MRYNSINGVNDTAESTTPHNQVVIRSDALTDIPKHELPTDYLMPEMAALVDHISSTLKCPPDIVISTMFAVVSGAVGTKVKVYDGIYTNMCNINLCHVAPPGSNKTHPVSMLVKPLENISMRMFADYKEEKKRCEETKDFSNMPDSRILYISNPTPEAINKTLAFNDHGLFARRDELIGFIDDLGGRYSNGSGGIPDFLSIFTNEHISIIRCGDEPLIINKPYLTVVGGIQPSLLPSVLGKPQLVNSGFNYRWLFVVPEIKPCLERSRQSVDTNQLDWWEQMIVKFYNMNPMTLTLDEGAQQVLSDYYHDVQVRKLNGNDYMNEVLDKLLIYVQKFAALATLMHGENVEFFAGLPKEQMGDCFADGCPCEPVVTAEAMEYAVRCMKVFEGWAEEVYDMIRQGDAPKKITLVDAIRTLNAVHPITNVKKFAESCGMKREQVYKYFPKGKDKNESNKQSINPEITPENSVSADKH